MSLGEHLLKCPEVLQASVTALSIKVQSKALNFVHKKPGSAKNHVQLCGVLINGRTTVLPVAVIPSRYTSTHFGHQSAVSVTRWIVFKAVFILSGNKKIGKG